MFHSRNSIYRNPTGAVQTHTNVHFKLLVPREFKVQCGAPYGRRRIYKTSKNIGMFWCGMNGENHEWWECDFTPEQPGLYFYRFEIDTWRGTLGITSRFGDESGIDEYGAPAGEYWQFTVYEPQYQAPDWLKGGIMYQIFPDRFYCSGTTKERYLKTVICINGGAHNRNGDPIIREKLRILTILAEIWKALFKNWIIYKV